MSKAIISTTRPNENGEMLWCVHYASSFYDSDPRAPGTVPIDGHYFVLAKGKDEAIAKVNSLIENARKRKDKSAEESITASIVTIEGLVPHRFSGEDGRLGWSSMQKYTAVQFACEEDKLRYRLAVCLVPIE